MAEPEFGRWRGGTLRRHWHEMLLSDAACRTQRHGWHRRSADSFIWDCQLCAAFAARRGGEGLVR